MDFFKQIRTVLSYSVHPKIDLSNQKPTVSHRASSKHFLGQRKQTTSSRQGDPFKTFAQTKSEEPKQSWPVFLLLFRKINKIKVLKSIKV